MIPSASHLEILHDAMAAAQLGYDDSSWYMNLTKAPFLTVKTRFQQLLESLDARGWEDSTVATAATFMRDAQNYAGNYWGNADLGIRWAQMMQELNTGGITVIPEVADISNVLAGAPKKVSDTARDVADGALNALKNIPTLLPWWVIPLIVVIAVLYVLSWLPRAPRTARA